MWGCRGWPPPKGLGLTPFRRVFVGFVGEVYLHERVILKSGIDGASVVLTGLQSKRTYYARLAAHDGVLTGLNYSAQVSFTTTFTLPDGVGP